MPSPKTLERQDRIARILVDAILTGDDEVTAAKYRTSSRNIRRWRARVTQEAGRESLVLAQNVQQKLASLNVDWGQAANAAIVAGLQYLTRAAIELPHSPEGVRAIAGYVKLVGELSALNRTVEAKLQKPATVTPLRATAEPRAKTG